MALSNIEAVVVKPIIFREYIGSGDNLHDFPDYMINDHMKEFHFIMCFVTDRYDAGQGTGVLDYAWNIKSFSPENVAKLKEKHLKVNVKVVISIGGDRPQDQFNPKDRNQWIVNATSSIRDIILAYQNDFPDDVIIAGIDINYNKIISSASDFSHCIGQVIQQLKAKLTGDRDVSEYMKVVSIAPTALLQSYYRQLYLDNKDNIDWIDYKFYDQSFETKEEVETLFTTLVSSDEYGDTASKKLLVGVKPFEATQTQNIVDGVKFLVSREKLAGVFGWDANTSAPTYVTEELLQKLLTKK